MRRNLFILFLLCFFQILLGIHFVLAITVSQEVLPATSIPSNGPPVLPPSPTPKTITPPATPPVIPPVITPVVPPFIPEVPATPPSIPSSIPEKPDTNPTTPSTPRPETPIFPSGGIIPILNNFIDKTSDAVNSPVGRTVTRVAQPLGIASGLTLLITQAILSTATMTITSLSDIYLLAWRLLGLLFGAKKSKGKPWGTVYDSVTKRPLDPAYVVVSKDTGEEVSDAITDLDGRYGFLVPTGNYRLKASKTNYSFPTKNLETKTNDEIYDSIYHGESLPINEGEVVVKNIPLDPIGFDWNEFEKNKQNLFRIYSDRERFWKKLFDVLYVVGLISAIVATVFDPRTINFVFLTFYAIFIIYSLMGNQSKKAVSVKFGKNNEPIPFAVIKIFFADLNNQVKTVIADHLGRFYFLVGPGKYYFTVDKKQPDGSYLNVFKSSPMDLPHGILDKDIIVS